MSESLQYARASLMSELVDFRTMACADKRREEEPGWGEQLDFWLESTIFWIIQLQISDEEGNLATYSEALNKAQVCLHHLKLLLD